MASLNMSFDPNAVEPDTGGGGGLHPEGDFQFEITESKVEATSNGKGIVAKLTFEGIGDDNKGRKVWTNINIQHESAQATAIGQGQLSALCKAADFVGILEDTEQLHNRPFWARIKHEQQIDYRTKAKLFHDDGAPKLRAEVVRFLFDDGEAASSAPAGKAQPQAANSNHAAANQNRPSPPAAGAAAAGGAQKRPWQK